MVYGITSEPHSLAAEAEEAWELGFPIVGDPHHELLEVLKVNGWLEIYFNEDYGHLRERAWASHPKGYFQPAVFAISKDNQILYRWRCVPMYNNMSGAGARPEARYTWDRIREQHTNGGDAPLDREPLMGSEELNWLQFLLILTAHGWFIRPKAFPLLRDGGKDDVTPAMAKRRAYWFVGAWLLALVIFPLAWVGLAFFAWLVVLIPGLIEIHRQFQNEPDPG